ILFRAAPRLGAGGDHRGHGARRGAAVAAAGFARRPEHGRALRRPRHRHAARMVVQPRPLVRDPRVAARRFCRLPALPDESRVHRAGGDRAVQCADGDDPARARRPLPHGVPLAGAARGRSAARGVDRRGGQEPGLRHLVEHGARLVAVPVAADAARRAARVRRRLHRRGNARLAGPHAAAGRQLRRARRLLHRRRKRRRAELLHRLHDRGRYHPDRRAAAGIAPARLRRLADRAARPARSRGAPAQPRRALRHRHDRRRPLQAVQRRPRPRHRRPRAQGGRRGALPREESRPQPGEPMTAAVIATLALFLVAAAWIYNRLVADRNQARQGFADIDVQLKRRADLVPQLVEAVRGYAAYEKALLTSVTELRASAAGAGALAERFGHERALGESLKKLLLLQESYPQLKADANFRKLSDELVEVEDHLQYARRFYNGAVQQYATRIETFPDLVVAKLFRFQPMPFFHTDEREAVRVSL